MQIHERNIDSVQMDRTPMCTSHPGEQDLRRKSGCVSATFRRVPLSTSGCAVHLRSPLHKTTTIHLEFANTHSQMNTPIAEVGDRLCSRSKTDLGGYVTVLWRSSGCARGMQCEEKRIA